MMDVNHVQLRGAVFVVDFGLDGFTIALEQTSKGLGLYDFRDRQGLEKNVVELSEWHGEYSFGEWVESDYWKFKLIKGKDLDKFIESQSTAASSFEFVGDDDVANWGLENLVAETKAGKQQSSLLTLEMSGPIPAQMVDYINASVEELQAYELRQKNQMAINTIEFIDSQLGEIEFDLKQSEQRLEQFRAENLIVDLGSEAAQMLQYLIELEQERSTLDLQQSFYRYVLDFLENERSYSGLSLPTLSSFDDPLVGKLAGQLVETSVTLERLSFSLDSKNPAIRELEKEVRFTKQACGMLPRMPSTQATLSSQT